MSYTYDPAYRRLTSMTDGTGTTTYSYYPVSSLGANQLESVLSPVAGTSNTDTVSYSYDALNREAGMTVDGAAQTIGYDAASRITSENNPLDGFTYSYADATPRVTGITSSHGPSLAMSYYGPQGDELLEQITATSGGTTLDQLGYTYNSNDNVTSFSVSSPSSQTTNYSYDDINRLLSGLIGSGTPQYQYGYDPASNLSSITQNGSTQNYTYTAANTITAGSYDGNGSPTALAGNSYTWDGANRLISFTGSSGATSAFTYNGAGRLVRVVDSNGGNVVADHSYLWCGDAVCLAHDNTQSGSPVSTQYFTQGSIIGGTPYYYVQDRLGSVRELVTASGTVATQYDYDPYGNPTLVSGTVGSDIGYAGYFYHAASGLEFTFTRAYDPVRARWLNRDPIGEAGGINLYAYVGGNPASFIDPTGRNAAALPWNAWGAETGVAGGSTEAGVAVSPVGWVGAAAIGGYAAGSWVYDTYGNQINDWIWDLTHPTEPTNDSNYHSELPPGYWPGPAGAAEWGRRTGVGAREGGRRFHRGVKQHCPGAKPTDVFGVNPATGDVIDPAGEIVDNLGDVDSE